MDMRDVKLGAECLDGGVRFSVWSHAAERVWVSLFDGSDAETDRVELARGSDDIHSAFLPGLAQGQLYGLRADGPYDPGNGLWFDPAKLLTDPYALQIDRPYAYDPRLAARRDQGQDTASLMPRAVVSAPPVVPLRPPVFTPSGLIYELNVRGFTMRHPDVPPEKRGTIAALAHPAIVEHLKSLHVGAVELMPITAWMDERHLPPLGLRNAWGYNPVTFMALDPRLAPGGWQELRETVSALHEAGIGLIVDVVFNHTAESDVDGPTLSLRGLDCNAYYRHDAAGRLVNDTGTGNTLACDHPVVGKLVIDSLRAFVNYAGVDGFRFDLAPVLGRDGEGFRPDAPLLEALQHDECLAGRVLIAEPWDIGPGGYQLGNFPQSFLEWNDRYRDDMRRFWRGDASMVGRLATRLAGSSDVFFGDKTRTVNFIAAHDGMTLYDLTAYETKHNHANGEANRDGHGENLSWNNGVEGRTDDGTVLAARRADVMALLATLFASRGTIMLTAGDEFGRTQAGNNNAYAQDNEITWLDWEGRDRGIEAFARMMAAVRAHSPGLRETTFLDESRVAWLTEHGKPMTVSDWETPDRKALTMKLGGLFVVLNGGSDPISVVLDVADGSSHIVAPSRSVSIHHRR